jgi:aminoglycoside 2''-phosphotransferase
MPADITPDDYRDWLSKQLPQIVAPDVSLVCIDSGWDSRVLAVNGRWIFRFARRPEIAGQFRKELQLLPKLADRFPVAVPNPEFARLDDPNFICMGYRILNGEGLTAAAATVGLAAQVGDFLNCLHHFPLSEVSQTVLLFRTPDEWRTKYLNFYKWIQSRLLPEVPPGLSKKMRNLWEGFLGPEANFQFDPVLIHADLGAEHILVDSQVDRLVGVIDWGDACLGDPALDFAGLLDSCGADFVRQALKSYARQVDDRFWDRMIFYRDIIPFYQMHYGLEFGEKGHFLEGLQAFTGNQNEIETDVNL